MVLGFNTLASTVIYYEGLHTLNIGIRRGTTRRHKNSLHREDIGEIRK